MLLVLGLGNPGERYARSRHNVGWRVLDRLAAAWEAGPVERGSRYDCRRARRAGREVALVRPLTYMNLSGEALDAWRARHGLVDAAALLVVTDDVYLPPGAIRLRARGSSGGHQGLASIERALGHRDFARLRVGVGAARSSAELREHVLEELTKEEEEAVEEGVALAADAVGCWVEEGVLAAMNRFNRRVRKEESET